MQRILIITTNCALLLLLLVGLPAATQTHLGNVQLSSASTGQRLMFWGLGIAVVGNILGATVFAFGRKAKILCLEWTVIFGGLLLAYYGFTRGYFNFDWLKHALQWLQKHF
ncbi:MAG: hypothetical protein ACREDS_00605 [Limisphaerales bacterium]